MAEAAGLVVRVVALAGLFNNTVQCFEYVQLGRAFGKDYQTSQLKLDSARLRLSRWGKSLDLDADDLGKSIQDLFADAEGVSEKFKTRAKAGDESLVVYDPKKTLDPPVITLHEQMHQLAIDRQNKTSPRQKTKWALYQQKPFSRLIDDVTELVDDLVDLFPASQPAQRDLCVEEVSAFDGNESLPLLKEVAATQDKMLEEALVKLAHKSGATYNNNFSGTFDRGSQAVGHMSGTINQTYN